MSTITILANRLAITEQRATVLELEKDATSIRHSLSIGRESCSAGDISELLDYLVDQGMPMEATIAIEVVEGRTRIHATWSTPLRDETEPNIGEPLPPAA